MAAVAILKVQKIATCPQWNDQFWRNLVKWCVSAIRPLSANEILLHILLSVISYFYLYLFTMSKAIPVSTGPIITIFSPNGRYLQEFSRFGPVFPIPQGTLPWQPILWQNCGKIIYPLHLSLCNSETEWYIATSMCALTV